ncbi:NAD(+) diphosphatase [Microbacterium sp. VKM Ac-2923]|uniref:NAD(+) diphosphatase n=1 Tax=Microbacterium sp. VKM Ac-2923 TaxID=2929476 RepID=UPI0027E1DF42|nr:NAD(+) diphosphatase [Microbacterium sp. VKM Ac-2923]
MSSPASSPSSAPEVRVDRSGAEREDESLLARVLTEPGTRILAVRRDAAPMTAGRLALVDLPRLRRAASPTGTTSDVEVVPARAEPLAAGTVASTDGASTDSASMDSASMDSASMDRASMDGASVERASTDGASTVSPAADVEAQPSVGECPAVPGVGHWAFLGRDDDRHAVVLAVLDDSASDLLVPDAVWAPLRAAGGELPAGEADLLTTAVALAGWLRDAPFCPACGSRTLTGHAGWSRHCPVCGREHFPRTDPAVIVLVTSAESDDRILLGANAAWGGQRYSCFAGFAEAGESLEDAVAREVQEESGVRLRDIAYRGSQAWPYPRSLMLGFRARVVDDGDARADGHEIVEVRWFTRDEVGAALRGEADVQLPGAASIARRLIDDWYRGIA